ncbi:MAG: 5'-methylthioadenosine/S-adenosylhomocysteine nucleosidase [Treponema sp.]|jgi:adenosylhomocysteine nucleosidase|nr:5'-methylthioadenosine/S-adenosylhomocysteine nucleosidase [Treponema sp.]
MLKVKGDGMTGIIGAMEDEITMVRDWMEGGESGGAGGFEFCRGTLEGKPVVLLRCGIGKVNAAVGCALLIDHYKPSLVINTGSAGGIDPALKFGDAIISTGLCYHDVDVTGFHYAPGQIPGQSAVFPVDEALVSRAERAVRELKGEGALPESFNYTGGIIASGDVFMRDPERIDWVRRTFPLVRAVEMEGAAIAHTCGLFSVPALIIRSLSDIAGLESPVSSEQFLPLAAKHSAEIVRRIIKNL